MHLHDYAGYDGVGLAHLIKAGSVSQEEVYAAGIDAIRWANEHVNGVADGPWDAPMAYRSTGPFGGIPTVVKDLVCHAEGIPTRLASRLTGDGLVFDYDTHCMRRLRDAGLAVAALSTAPEFGYCSNTISVRHGLTRNPWDLGRSAGGSSGGTAALVAAGAVPIGHGNDGAGSIRIPAAFNGLVGLKPSRGRISIGPEAEDLFGLVVEFGHTRTVRDCAALLDALCGRMAGDPFVANEPKRPWSHELGTDPGTLTVALHTESWSECPTDGEVIASVEAVGRQLEALGHAVEPARFELDWDEFLAALTAANVFEVGYTINAVADQTGNEPNSDTLEHTNLATYADWRKVTATDLFDAKQTLKRIAVRLDLLLAERDLLVLPTTNVPAPPIDYIDPNDPAFTSDTWLREILKRCSFTAVFNATGHPALSLPLGWTADGHPSGVQFVSRMGDEATLFRLASQLEQAMPWADRRPAVFVGEELVRSNG